MKKLIFVPIFVVSFIFLVMSLSIDEGLTQEQEPLDYPDGFSEPAQVILRENGLRQAANGDWFMLADSQSPGGVTVDSPAATGGPDEFGYTWDDSAPLSWIDASSGTSAGLNSNVDHSGPINIGFPFKYYENTYSQLYISRFGYLTFDHNYTYNSQSEVPSIEPPNDVIAPHWVPSDDVLGYVRYLSGGIEPNRWFVVEWNRLYSLHDGLDEYTFEAVLHENGDIVFQYGSIITNGSRWCEATGIEDSIGIDGLTITDFCDLVASNHAVRINRPAPSARVKIWPPYQGKFTSANKILEFEVPIRNIGELGADVYDLFPTSSWSMTLYDTDGTTLLTDTDGDFTIDTGTVAQGAIKTIVAKVETPTGVSAGDANAAVVFARSSVNLTMSDTATLQSSVPAPFAQVYQDNADGAMSLYLAQPSGQKEVKASVDYHFGNNPAVAETPNGNFVYAWSKWSGGSVSTYDLQYTIINKFGETVKAISRLTDNRNATVNTYDYPVLAVTPDGHIGVAWYRYLYNTTTGLGNYNIYFAVLNDVGDKIYGPVSLTNNSAWGTWDDLYWPRFFDPRIAATSDNRFVLSWNREHRESSGYVDDIYYTIRSSAGGQIRGITKLTNDSAGWSDGYYDPTLAALSGNRVLLAFQRSGDYDDIYYVVLNSSGNIVRGMTNLSYDGSSSYDWSPDAVELANGNILVAWTGGDYPDYEIHYAVLNSSYGNITGTIALPNPASLTGDGNVSVTADANNHGFLTWTDYRYENRRYLYYALVNGSGSIITNPMIFYTSEGANSQINSSYLGYGNTSYSWTPPAGVDAVVKLDASLYGGAPGGAAAINVNYANHGETIATGVILTATLDSELTYLSDTSGFVPVIAGDDVIWTLPDLSLLESVDFMIYVELPVGAVYGTRYPISFSLTSSVADENPGDNTTAAEVMAAHQIFLPTIMKD